MKYWTFFSEQARKPTGIFGRFYMSRVFEKGNAELNALMFETVPMEENDHVLEIGCGTGMLIKHIADNLSQGLIEGIDFSKQMVAMARKKNKKHLNSGQVKIHLGDFEQAEFEANSFDKIYTAHTIYFWKKPGDTIAKIHRILRPGGRLVIGFRDKSEMEKMPLNKDIFKYYSAQDLKELLVNHGALAEIDIVFKKSDQITNYCAVCMKSKT
ncbi:MAG: class I SAM-dependent methyltransferase [Deltaproteobacteria bacterium]|nr:class I SAM-dependent methyltransferase [Deltaproteobacteria bacterium]